MKAIIIALSLLVFPLVAKAGDNAKSVTLPHLITKIIAAPAVTPIMTVPSPQQNLSETELEEDTFINWPLAGVILILSFFLLGVKSFDG